MELSHRLIDRGFHVTFVNTDFASLPSPLSGTGLTPPLLRLVSIPDGLEPDADRNNLMRLTLAMQEHMPGLLEELLVHNTSGESLVTCIIADRCIAWALDVAKKIGLRAAAFSTTSAGALVRDGAQHTEDDRRWHHRPQCITVHGLFEFSPKFCRMKTFLTITCKPSCNQISWPIGFTPYVGSFQINKKI
ncbi:UDP-glycosyltransferase 83A1 [Acorus calamus]|uniref:UDP-glycosyltransferase 83A1 n=1 Tax=Acorus calamus TaxID=4465 RepID=A0AAV9E9F3_ACOCL|nr:UDP-glycosyltransferase 83A1 [Acorus calamus]